MNNGWYIGDIVCIDGLTSQPPTVFKMPGVADGRYGPVDGEIDCVHIGLLVKIGFDCIVGEDDDSILSKVNKKQG